MCGIVYSKSFNKKQVNKYIKKQFYKQQSRGIDGFGVYDVEHNHIIKEPRKSKIIRWLNKYQRKEILFHHRFPTSTDNTRNACHPFSTKGFFNTNYVLVHNGVISNAKEVKAHHDKLGIVYSSMQADGSFNDSEALLWEFALYKEGMIDAIRTRGSVALICIATNKEGKKLYFARNSNPLNLHYEHGKFIRLASVGAGKAIEPYTLYTFDHNKNELSQAGEYINIPEWTAQTTTPYAFGGTQQRPLLGDPYAEDFFEEEEEENYYNDPEFKTWVDDTRTYIKELVEEQEITEDEVSDMYNEYMRANEGNINDAFDQAYDDYVLSLDMVTQEEFDFGTCDAKDLKDMKLLVAVCEKILKNPFGKDNIDYRFVPSEKIKDMSVRDIIQGRVDALKLKQAKAKGV